MAKRGGVGIEALTGVIAEVTWLMWGRGGGRVASSGS